MTSLDRFALVCVATLSAAGSGLSSQDRAPSIETAGQHHTRGVEYHLARSVDQASAAYARALTIDPPREASSEELAMVRRFAPRIYVTRTEFFPLKDAAAIVHPTERLIAYPLFWEDDIDFPDDNDPCDHELVWVRYSDDRGSIEKFWTYFHGRILDGGDVALRDAREHAMRPRVNVQWGKHGSMPAGWENLPIVANDGDIERGYLKLDVPITLRQYNEATFRKISSEGRRRLDHPIAKRLGWPERFQGTWPAFVDFSRPIDMRSLLEQRRLIAVSRWNSGVIDQHFLTYNFRPKTEWPIEVEERARVRFAR